MHLMKASLTGQAKAVISGMGFSSQSYFHAWDILCENNDRSDVIVNAQIISLYSCSSSTQRFYEHRQICIRNYKCGKHFNSTWIHILPRIRRRAKFNNDKTFSATLHYMCLHYIQDGRLQKQIDCFQRVACIQRSSS